MGVIGGAVGSAIGSIGGQMVGGSIAGGKYKKEFGSVGSAVGGVIGGLTPFKKGGLVKKKTQPALLHKGEWVVPSKYASQVPKSLKEKILKDNKK